MQRFWPTCHQSCRAKIWPHTACRVLFRFCFSFLSPWFLMGSGHKPLPGRAQTYCGKGYLVIWTELCFRQIHMLKPSSLVLQNVTVFGDKWGHQAGPSRNMTGALMRRGTWSTETRVCPHRAQTTRAHNEGSRVQAGKRILRMKPSWFWTSGLQYCVEIHFWCLSHPLWGVLLQQS